MIHWEAVGAIGEILGAIAVVVSIVYLALQIRSNTRATKAAAGFDATHSWAAFNEWAVGLAPQLKSDVARAYSPDASWDEFSAGQRTDISLLHRALFQKLEGQYILYQYGFLEEGIWQTRSKWAAALISLPFFVEWWTQEKAQLIYSKNFVEVIESIAAVDIAFAGARSTTA